jgi:hypothetical protein
MLFDDAGFFLIPVVAIIGGITLAIVNSINRSRVRELEIRERIAMIERGLMPAPETDPKGFERAEREWRRAQLIREHRGWEDDGIDDYYAGSVTDRHRRAGMIIIGVGAGLIFLLAPSYRVGAFLMVLGFAFLISSFFEAPRRPRPPRRQPPVNSPDPSSSKP